MAHSKIVQLDMSTTKIGTGSLEGINITLAWLVSLGERILGIPKSQ